MFIQDQAAAARRLVAELSGAPPATASQLTPEAKPRRKHGETMGKWWENIGKWWKNGGFRWITGIVGDFTHSKLISIGGKWGPKITDMSH